MSETIAIIEDDMDISDLMEEVLKGEGYEVLRAFSGTEALLLFERSRPDLVLLDLMLPGLSGEEVLKRTPDIPIIVVSAKAGIDHKVDVLLDGAADYITKPFDTRELIARVAVQLRQREQRTGRQTQTTLVAGQNPANSEEAKVRQETYGAESGLRGDLRSGLRSDSRSGSHSRDGISMKNGKACGFQKICDLTVDELSLEITCNGLPLKLTRTEYAILQLLLGNPNRNLAKSVILDRIAAETPDCTEDSLKQHISHIRTKLERAGSGMKIESVWGIGYRLTERQ